MKTARQPLAGFSSDVRASDLQGEKLNSMKHAARERLRSVRSAPPIDHATRIAKIAAGETVPPAADDIAERRNAENACRDLEEASELHHSTSRAIRFKALKELCKYCEPEHDAIVKRMAVACVELHAAISDFEELKDYLISQGGFVGICLTDTEKLFGRTNDRTSNFSMLLREFVQMKHLKEMPKGLK